MSYKALETKILYSFSRWVLPQQWEGPESSIEGPNQPPKIVKKKFKKYEKCTVAEAAEEAAGRRGAAGQCLHRSNAFIRARTAFF